MMIDADLRPMSSAPLDGTPVQLFVSTGWAIASFWSEDRSQKAFGAGDYRPGWYLLDDDSVELDDATGWKPLMELTALVLSEKKKSALSFSFAE
jgi:hypothetical protein